jgi:SSS family solute:Na+ symporter
MTHQALAVVPRMLVPGDYALIALYLAVNLAIGAWCARRRQASSRDFFLGGGRVSWWAAAVSFCATATSSISFMALPAKSFRTDWEPFGSAPAQAGAGILMGLVFAGILRRLNLTTIFGYLERRFDRNVRLLGAGLGVLLKIGGRMSVIMLLPALALSTVTGLNVYASIAVMGGVTTVYAAEGGFEAVVWTDVMQTVVTYGGVALALLFLARGVPGGFSGIVHAGAAAGKFHAVSWSFDPTRPTVWVFVGMFLGHIFTQLADQPLMQRMLATKDEREARRTLLFGNLLGLGTSVLFFFVGSSLFVFYHQHPEKLAHGLPDDAIFPYFIANELPHGVVGLIVAGLFAAAMGALSSTINATAAVVVTDFQKVLYPQASAPQQIRLAKITTLLCGVLATGMATWLAARHDVPLWDRFLMLNALIGGGFPGVFALGLLTRRANPPGVIVGALASIGITWWVEAYTKTSAFLDSFIAIASCFVLGYLASLCFQAKKPAWVEPALAPD